VQQSAAAVDAVDLSAFWKTKRSSRPQCGCAPPGGHQGIEQGLTWRPDLRFPALAISGIPVIADPER
jgi:hypothetical protein